MHEIKISFISETFLNYRHILQYIWQFADVDLKYVKIINSSSLQ